MSPSTALIVFARAPQPGLVKTRLIPALGKQGALDLYRAMLAHALQVAAQFAPDELILACAPNSENADLQAMGELVNASMQDQCAGDLGARMHHALATALKRHQIALLMGSDCPTLRSADLHQVRDRLLGGASTAEMAFIPANDGGYVLVGARQICARVFEQMPWGSGEVMKLTRARLRCDGKIWYESKAHNDIDRAEDLSLLPAEFRKLALGAPKF